MTEIPRIFNRGLSAIIPPNIFSNGTEDYSMYSLLLPTAWLIIKADD